MPPLRVLFVSKPIAPPWHDGSKNLVRDIALHLTRAEPTVLTTPSAPALGGRVRMEPVYREAGRFAPSLSANARVLARLLFGDPLDVWHFVFAPNAASSGAARVAVASRRAMGFRGPVVQTIASAPRSFAGIQRWLFGDHVVALSDWARGRLLGAGVDPQDVSVIAPCVPVPRAVSGEEVRALRERFDLGSGPVILYPGDYEVSTGAQTVARAVPLVARAVPDVRFVFACRPKTPRAAEARAHVEAALREAKHEQYVRHLGEVDDMTVLLAAASCVAFPVDDLYGKVDVPLVLLEALAAGVPIIAARGGPLEALTSAEFVDAEDAPGLANAARKLLSSAARARARAEEGRALHHDCFRPDVVARHYEDLYGLLAERASRKPSDPRRMTGS